MEHLQFGVFTKLVELDACFESASVVSIREMKRITPNLKKIVIQARTSDKIDTLLGSLEKLESVKIVDPWEMSENEEVYPIIKHFDVNINGSKINVELIKKKFPNLEDLKISVCSLEVTGSLIDLLIELKQLKSLYMFSWSRPVLAPRALAPESALQLIQQHGERLREANIIFEIGTPDETFAIEKKPGNTFRIIKSDEIDLFWCYGCRQFI